MKEFEYFEGRNRENICIEDRGARVGRYAVWHNNVIIDDCLNKKTAHRIACDLFLESRILSKDGVRRVCGNFIVENM